MDIIEIAVASGMQITLDGRIGTQEYRSVYGSLQALRRFADAVILAAPFMVNLAVLTEDEGQPVSSELANHESEP